MDAEKIRSLRLAEPFVPFRLRLNDGRSFEVPKPFHLAISQSNNRVLVVTGPEAAVWFSPDVVQEVELMTNVPDAPAQFIR